MTYEFVTLTNQVTTAQWGWTIALFLWFIGLAGMSLVLNVWLRSKLVLVISAISAVVGTLFVLSHLHRLLNLPMAAINSLLGMCLTSRVGCLSGFVFWLYSVL